MRQQIQRFGSFMAAMVVPNIGALLAWGLITALFIPVGWIPNETFAKLVGPMINYLLPILIGYTGGKLLTVPELLFDDVLRATETRVDWGGKGFNVARMLAALGAESLA